VAAASASAVSNGSGKASRCWTASGGTTGVIGSGTCPSARSSRSSTSVPKRRASGPRGQLGVHRWTPDRAVEGLELPADVAQLDEAVDGTQQVIGRHMLLETEAVEQRLLPDLPLAHHGRALLHQED
jgi:hypothetical protein